MIARSSQAPSGLKIHVWAAVMVALCLCIWTAPALAVEGEDLPEAGAILDRAVEAMGGTDAMKAVETRYTSGKFSLPAMGIEASLQSWAKRPNLTYTEISSPALGQMLSGSDGEHIWENSAMTGPNLKEGEERAVSARQNDMDGLVNWRKHYSEVETLGREEVDGTLCYKVALTPHDGHVETHYYNVETGLLVKMEMTMKSEMGEIPIESFLSDYREIEGLMIPFKTRQVIMQMQEMVSVVDSVAINVEIPPDRFALPAEIQALVEKKAVEGK